MNHALIDCTPAEVAACRVLVAALRDGRAGLALTPGERHLFVEQTAAGGTAGREIAVDDLAGLSAAAHEIERRPAA